MTDGMRTITNQELEAIVHSATNQGRNEGVSLVINTLARNLTFIMGLAKEGGTFQRLLGQGIWHMVQSQYAASEPVKSPSANGTAPAENEAAPEGEKKIITEV